VNPADLASDLDFEKGHKRHQQDVTLAVALFLKDEISKEKDLAVLLTREKDQKIDLDEEVKMIEKNKPDFLIELHVNKGFGKKSSGFEIYCPDYTTAAASQKINANQLQLRNRSRSDSLRMARIVQDHFNQLFPRKSRGIRKANTPLNEKSLFLPWWWNSALSVTMRTGRNCCRKKLKKKLPGRWHKVFKPISGRRSMERKLDRRNDELRPIQIINNYLKTAPASALVEFGNTKVLCAASLDDKTAPFLKGTGRGWLTAEYSMLPMSTQTRTIRESSRGKLGGRTHEIQRMIGRSLRAVTDLTAFGEKQSTWTVMLFKRTEVPEQLQ